MWGATRERGLQSRHAVVRSATGMTSPPIELDEVQAVVREHVAAIEHERRLPDAVVEALHRSGLHRLAIPAELGGLEAPVRTTVAAVAAIAATDGSTGWCAAIGAGSNVFAGYLPRDRRTAVLPPIQTRAAPRCSSRRARLDAAGRYRAASRAAGRSPATACTAPGPGSGARIAPSGGTPRAGAPGRVRPAARPRGREHLGRGRPAGHRQPPRGRPRRRRRPRAIMPLRRSRLARRRRSGDCRSTPC